jgi:hypothetical protein
VEKVKELIVEKPEQLLNFLYRKRTESSKVLSKPLASLRELTIATSQT